MALQFSAGARNGQLDSIETTVGTAAVLKMFTGAAPADCATANSGTELASWTLAADWAGAASAGTKAFSNTPLEATAVGSGTAAHFRLYASDGTTCHMQGTVTSTGGGGDMTVDNTNIATDQQVNITAFTLTAPGA